MCTMHIIVTFLRFLLLWAFDCLYQFFRLVHQRGHLTRCYLRSADLYQICYSSSAEWHGVYYLFLLVRYHAWWYNAFLLRDRHEGVTVWYTIHSPISLKLWLSCCRYDHLSGVWQLWHTAKLTKTSIHLVSLRPFQLCIIALSLSCHQV